LKKEKEIKKGFAKGLYSELVRDKKLDELSSESMAYRKKLKSSVVR